MLEAKKFRRSILSLISRGLKSHSPQDGDFQWQLWLKMNKIEFPDGSIVSGDMIRLGNFFGKLTLGFDGQEWGCTTTNQDELIEQVLAIISNNSP